MRLDFEGRNQAAWIKTMFGKASIIVPKQLPAYMHAALRQTLEAAFGGCTAHQASDSYTDAQSGEVFTFPVAAYTVETIWAPRKRSLLDRIAGRHAREWGLYGLEVRHADGEEYLACEPSYVAPLEAMEG